MQNRVGQQFGRYSLLQFLGRGGFAEVYLGEHVHLQSRVAIKILYGQLSPNDAKNFKREAQTLARLEHTHIIRIRDYDTEQGIPFLVMDYASKGTLLQHHPRGQYVPLQRVVSYVLQIASALQYAHDLNIVHRDVKPGNMLIDSNDTILLSDFGIAALSLSSSNSRAGAGTPLYIAPEQSAGKALPASDQYALGITVYEWLCGEAPFVGTPSEITSRHLTMPPQPLWQRGVFVGPQVEAVIARALAKDPSQRFASVQQFAQALQSSSNALSSNNNMPLPAPGSNNSILPAPSRRTPDFSFPSAPPPQSHLTPSPIAPTIFPSYAPTQLAPPYVQPRKTGFPCLATALISVAAVFVIVIGSTFATPLVSWLLPPRATATSIQTPTSSPRATATSIQTPTSSPEATATPNPALTPTVPADNSPTNTPATATSIPAPVNTPEQLISDFCQFLPKGADDGKAYAMYSTNLKNQINYDTFHNYWSGNNKQYYSITSCPHEPIPTPSGNKTTARWSTHEFYSGQEQQYNVTFVIQGNEWKIDNITEA